MEIRPDEEVLKTNHQQHETINIQNQNRITKNTLTNQLTEPKINRMCMESANHSGLYPDIKCTKTTNQESTLNNRTRQMNQS